MATRLMTAMAARLLAAMPAKARAARMQLHVAMAHVAAHRRSGALRPQLAPFLP